MECEICGKKAEMRAKVEGTIVDVCHSCSRLGVVLAQPNVEQKPRVLPQLKQVLYKYNIAGLVKTAREKKGLSRKELAEKLGEKEALIERIEKGMNPTLHVAKKIEKSLGISLLQQEMPVVLKPPKKQSITIGDIVQIIVKKKPPE